MVKMQLSPQVALAGGGSVVDSLFNFPPIGLWGFFVCSLFCYAIISTVLSSFAIILKRKRELIALL